MRLCEFHKKKGGNVCDCRNLGCVDDLEFDECTGKIHAMVIKGPARWLGMFGRDCEYVIGWDKIVRIGPDIILVDVCLEKVRYKM